MSSIENQECPYCLETIKNGAIKCKHCHSILNSDRSSKQISDNSPVNSSTSEGNFSWHVHQQGSTYTMDEEQVLARWKDGSIYPQAKFCRSDNDLWQNADEIGLPPQSKLLNTITRPTWSPETLNKMDDKLEPVKKVAAATSRVGSYLTLFLSVPLAPIMGFLIYGTSGLYIGIIISIVLAVWSIHDLTSKS